jgi:hypothetical protein
MSFLEPWCVMKHLVEHSHNANALDLGENEKHASLFNSNLICKCKRRKHARSTMVEHPPHYPRYKGSSPPTAAGTGGQEYL